MDEIEYLTADDIIDLHDEIVAETGTSHASLRGGGLELLESAAAVPRWAAYYEEATIFEQAARLAIAISQSQPFEDGNKRAAYASAVVFLKMNGWDIVGDPLTFAGLLEAVAEAPKGEERDGASATMFEWLGLNCWEVTEPEGDILPDEDEGAEGAL